MPGQTRIDSIIDRESTQKEISDLKAGLKDIDNVIKNIKPVSLKLMQAEGISELKKIQSEIVNLNKSVADSYKTLTKIQSDNTKATLDNEKVKQQQLKTDKETVKVMQEEEKQEQQQIKTKKLKRQEQEAVTKLSMKEAKQAAELSNDYLQLSKAYNDAALKAKNYALVLGEQHPTTVQAIKDAKGMYDTLYRLDTAVGQHTRNVGNYKSAFNGLNQSFAQVARELPSLTISAQQFFLAISNNLPMVADEIARAKVEIAALKAEGKETPSLFQRIGGALFSWQTLLAVGITLLTAYGKELIDWVSSMFKGADATKVAAERLSEYAREADNAKTSLSEFNSELQNMQQVYSVNNKIRFFGNDAQQQLTETKNNLAFIIAEYTQLGKAVDESTSLTTKASDAFSKIIAQYGNGSEEAKKAEENYNKVLQAQFDLQREQEKKLNDVQLARKQVTLAELQFQDEQNKKQKELADEAAKKREEAAKKFKESLRDQLTALNEFSNALKESDLNKLEAISNDEDALPGLRVVALKKYLDLKSKLIKEDAENEIIVNESTAAQSLAIRQKALNSIFELQTSTDQKITEIRTKADEDAKKKMLETEEKFQDSIIAMGDEASRKLKIHRDEDVAGAKLAADKKLEIEKQYQSAKQALVAKEFEAAQGLIDLGASLVESSYERQKNDLQDLIDLQNKRYAQEIENIRNSTLSEQDKAAKITQIQAQQQAQQEIAEQKQRQLSAKQANVERAAQIASVVGQTLQSVGQIQSQAAIAQAQALTLLTSPYTAALYPAAQAAVATILAQIPLTIGLGAAQVAKIAATPIPRYAQGVEDAPKSTIAKVSERGQELYIGPDGKMFFTPKQESLMFVEKGATIIPNNKLQEMYASNTMNKIIAYHTPQKESDLKQLEKSIVSGFKFLTKEIVSAHKKNRPFVKVINKLDEDFKKHDYIRRNLL